MTTPLRVLILEDKPADARLMTHELQSAGFNLDWRRVDSEADFLTFLNPDLDIILSDYNMPQFNAGRALELLRASGQDVPLIVVSGSIGEDLAVAALNQGAADYLLKDRLSRLGTAVTQALERRRLRAEGRLAEQRLREETATAETLHQLGAMLAAELDLHKLVQAVIDAATRLVNAHMGALFYHLPDAAGELRTLFALAGSPLECFGGLPLPRHTSLLGLTFRQQKTVRIPDLTQDARFGQNPPYHGLPAGHPALRSYLAVPVVSRSGEVLGGLFFGHAEPGRFSERDERVIAGLASHAAIAIDNARLYQQAQEANRLLSALVESSEDAIISLSVEGRITSWNPGAARLCGYASKEIMGQPVTTLVHPERLPEFEKLLAQLLYGQRVPPFETVWQHRDGRRVEVSLSLAPLRDGTGAASLGASVIARDITERKKLEDQYRHAQKMEAIGLLAGGVAHDFNNLLTVINGYCEMLLAGMPPAAPDRDAVQQIANAGDRATALTGQLLAFSRKQIVAPQVLDLRAVVGDTQQLLKRLIGEDIELATVSTGPLGAVKADAGQVAQLLVNFAVNARAAMPRAGKFTIELRNVELDAGYARTHPDASAGPHVLLAVSDTGVGMDASTRARVFEPFFTTKGDKGTGLGLATVYGIVRGHGGHVTVYSESGYGTTFKVYLPCVEERLSPRKSFAGRAAALPPGTETILFVEDEEAVRSLVRQVLTGCGYRLLVAVNGADAVRLAGQHPEHIDLLLTDVVMPQMGGREVAERLTALRPGLKVLYLSGYTDDAVVRHGILQADVEFLQKPFTPTSLACKVRAVLDGG